MNTFQIQQLLKLSGYYAGNIDGDVGKLTRDAVDKILKKNKIATKGWNEFRRQIAAGQLVLRAMNHYAGKVDGVAGPLTAKAVSSWQDAMNSSTKIVLPEVDIGGGFDEKSQKRLAGAHPLLQKLLVEARKEIAFQILDSQRGKAAQEKAFKAGHSKAHFGQSAHNWAPAVAVDLAPVLLDWNDLKAFRAIQKVIGWWDPAKKRGAGLAKRLGIPIRWGGDWNMDGNPADGWDLPHYELHPWRTFAKDAKPFTG